MPTALPIIRGTSTALYPFSVSFVCMTGVSDSQAAVPTRWVKGPPRVRLELPYNPLLQSQKATLRAAFSSAKGQFTGGTGSAGLTTTIANPALTFSDLGFDTDEFAAMERMNTQYGVKWTVTQALPQDLSPGSSGAPYPACVNGAISQLPYTQKKRFQTLAAAVASGPKYTFAEFGGGLTNFPADGLLSWDLDEPQLVDADVAAKITHFLNNWGMAFPFTFTDEWDATSTTSIAIGTGSRTFTTQTNLEYVAGLGVHILSRSTGDTMDGTVTSYSGTTLVVNITAVTGSGTFTDWNIAPTYSNVYYGSDTLTVQYVDINRTRIQTSIIQMN